MSRNTSVGVPEWVLEAVSKLLSLLSSRVRIEAAYLFGSYAKGTWVKTSDIDLIVVSRDFEGKPYLERLDMINEIQWRARIRPFIEAIPLTPEELEEKLKTSVVLRDASKHWIEIHA